jgi:hypothetical protein
MAEPQFQIVDIPGIGQREVPGNLKGADLDKFVQQIIQLESPQVTTDADIPTFTAPTVQVTQDIPTDENLAPTPQAPQRPMSQEFMRRAAQIPQNIVGSAEAAATLGTGMLSTLGGTLAGIVKEPFTGEPAEQTAQRIQQGLTYTPRTEAGQRITQDVAGALGVFEGLPPYAPVPSRFGIRKPSRIGTGTTGSILDRVPSQETLGLQAQKLYDNATKSGVQFKTDAFNEKLLNIGREMRGFGYTPKANTDLSAVFKEGLETRVPKDFTELQSIRQMFKTAASDKTNPDYARQAMIALDKFDDYMLNAPKEDFVVAGKQGLESWKQARIAYSKMKKSELFEDMINTAELKTAQGGNLDRTLLNDLTALSKDKNKMKFFTPDEKARINKLVKARDARGITQRIFSLGGLLAPGFGSRASQVKLGAYGYGAGAYDPLTAGAIAGGTLLSKLTAEQMRKGGIRDLARFARAGGTEIAPGGSAYQVQLPTGAEFYGAGGLLSNVLEEQTQ